MSMTTSFLIRRISRENDELKQLHATAVECKQRIQQYYANKNDSGGGGRHHAVLPVECHEFLPHYRNDNNAPETNPKQAVVVRST
ncbi:hypothetical protein DYB30_006287 [Aphanomyces astaci]|uniref:Uncharacterized protein n=1 Tax=Aphanomyces astaci TaxID=112090 RepID=A0A397DPQ2_APHAT|nr:hypothetical protein DYB30_006287 [Aphanomyces astaci]